MLTQKQLIAVLHQLLQPFVHGLRIEEFGQQIETGVTGRFPIDAIEQGAQCLQTIAQTFRMICK